MVNVNVQVFPALLCHTKSLNLADIRSGSILVSVGNQRSVEFFVQNTFSLAFYACEQTRMLQLCCNVILYARRCALCAR